MVRISRNLRSTLVDTLRYSIRPPWLVAARYRTMKKSAASSFLAVSGFTLGVWKPQAGQKRRMLQEHLCQ
jgi:hypothetical protein